MTKPAGRTVRDLRRANRAALLSRLYFDGPLSRQELITTVGLSAASVSKLIADLVREELVVEAGSVGLGRRQATHPAAGQPRRVRGDRRRRRRNPGPGRTVRPRPATSAPAPSSRSARATSTRRGSSTGSGPACTWSSTAAASTPTASSASGSACPAWSAANRPRWSTRRRWAGSAVPLQDMLAEVTDLPLYIDNGATTMGQAEMWFGAGRGAGATAIVLIGSGVGAAIVVGGSRVPGLLQQRGGVGAHHGRGVRPALPLRRAGLHRGVRRGGCDHRPVRGETGRTTAARRGPGARARPDHRRRQPGRPRTRRSAAARDVLAETATYLGIGIANLINLLNPERVLLGGWAGLLLGPADAGHDQGGRWPQRAALSVRADPHRPVPTGCPRGRAGRRHPAGRRVHHRGRSAPARYGCAHRAGADQLIREPCRSGKRFPFMPRLVAGQP